jgi:hypothetical protein
VMFVSGTWIERDRYNFGHPLGKSLEPLSLKLLDVSPRIAPIVRTGFALPSWVGEIQQDEYSEIRAFCDRLLSHYAAEECLFVGIGRSPTPIIGFFQETQTADAMNLPLSRFRHRPTGRAVQLDEKKRSRYQPLGGSALKVLYQHFDRFFLFGPLEVWQRRRWVLVDFSQTGDTLVSAFDYLSAYLRHRRMGMGSPSLEILCLVDPRDDAQEIEAAFGRRPVCIWRVDGYPNLAGGLSLQRFDLASEFGTFTIDDTPRTPVNNEAYLRLRAAIRRERSWELLLKTAK